jgi:hypothetical protein
MNLESDKSNQRSRLRGLGLLVIGLACAKLQIYDPLRAAEMGLETVWIHFIFVSMGVVGTFMGVLYLIFGSRPNKWFKFDPQRLQVRNVFALLAAAGVQLAIIFYVLHALRMQGYRI